MSDPNSLEEAERIRKKETDLYFKLQECYLDARHEEFKTKRLQQDNNRLKEKMSKIMKVLESLAIDFDFICKDDN